MADHPGTIILLQFGSRMVVMAMPVPVAMLAEPADMARRLRLVGAPLVEGFGLVALCAAAGPAMGR